MPRQVTLTASALTTSMEGAQFYADKLNGLINFSLWPRCEAEDKWAVTTLIKLHEIDEFFDAVAETGLDWIEWTVKIHE